MKHMAGRMRVVIAMFGLAVLGTGTAAHAGGLICPGVCVGGSNHGERCFSVSECPGAGTACQLLDRCIYIEWRPPQVVVPAGGVANLQLWAYSSDDFTIPLDGSDILLSWDETRVSLLGKTDPCLICAGGTNSGNLCQLDTQCPGSACVTPGLCYEGCPSQTYNWFASVFPNDCLGDGLNAPCAGGVPANDGDAHYQNFKQIECGGAPGDPAQVTPLGAGTGGLHLTTFRFQPLITEGGALVDIPLELGMNAETRFVGGTVPGQNLLGLIGNPVQIIVADICDPPTVAAAGPRYLRITPAAGTAEIALLVRGSVSNPSVSCVDKYVQTVCRGGPTPGIMCFSDAACGGGTCDLGKLLDVCQGGPNAGVMCTRDSECRPNQGDLFTCNGTLTGGVVTPQYQLPSEWGTILVAAKEIEPNTLYTVRADCGAFPGDLLSNAVSATTRIWGDTASGNGVNFADITKTVDAFRGTLGVAIEETDLSGPNCNPQFVVNFADITANVDAFRQIPYRSACPAPCP